jgi:hypothetical protein
LIFSNKLTDSPNIVFLFVRLGLQTEAGWLKAASILQSDTIDPRLRELPL